MAARSTVAQKRIIVYNSHNLDDNAALSEAWRESEESMGLLYALESIRTPLLDKILGAVTYLGDELCFMVFAVGVFWCISKRMGYYLMTVGFFGTILNQFLKILCAVPRPWVKDPGFTIVESARAGASGYSFPSGHTQNAVTLYGGTARYTKTPWLRWVCIAVMVLICFSRMYLGVHTPLDVGVAFLMALALLAALYPVFRSGEKTQKAMPYLLAAGIVLAGLFVLYVGGIRADFLPGSEDESNLSHAVKKIHCVSSCSYYIPLRVRTLPDYIPLDIAFQLGES